jgi:RND superfamily putative drug exporter
MRKVSRSALARRWLLAAWLLLSIVGPSTAQRATAPLSNDPPQPGPADQQIARQLGAGQNAPVLVVVSAGTERLAPPSANSIMAALATAAPGLRLASYADQPALLSNDGRTGVIAVYPRPIPGTDTYAAALPAIRAVAARWQKITALHVAVTGRMPWSAARPSSAKSAQTRPR